MNSDNIIFFMCTLSSAILFFVFKNFQCRKISACPLPVMEAFRKPRAEKPTDL